MKEFCVISHTHWDREWYMPFEAFRLKLVDLIDSLIEIIEKHPDYIFHLDAQTVVLEDYLEIRPDREASLKELISSSNIYVGPWYLQNDFYLTSGEATIRNLLEGKKISKKFNGTQKFGYAPDQFGNISQLPQILKNFGIDTFVFGRGYNEFEKTENETIRKHKPCEFIWEGADDSQLLSVFMGFWYNNAQRFSKDMDKVKVLLDLSERNFDSVNVTPYILMMNGVDHLEPQEDLLPILEQARIEQNRKIKQYSFPDYLDLVKNYVSTNHIQLSSHKGELNKGHDYELLKGCWSSRIYLKHENVKAQNLLENVLEPLYSMMELSGFKNCTPSDQLRYLWKMLLKNHPHDSICGCSNDAVHRHMEDSFQKVGEIAQDLLERGLKLAANHLKTEAQTADDYKIIVINTLEMKTNAVIRAEIEIPLSDNIKGIHVRGSDGKNIEFAVVKRFTRQKDIFSPLNLPGIIDVEVFSVLFYLPKILPYTFNSLQVTASDVENCILTEQEWTGECAEIENEFLKLSVGKNGIRLTDKRDNRVFERFVSLEDSADRGDAYVYIGAPEQPLRFFSPSSFRIIQNNDYEKTVQAEFELALPACYDFKQLKRSDITEISSFKIDFVLKKQSDVLELNYLLINKSKDHRLRVVFDSKTPSTITYADTPFDINKRENSDLYFDTKAKIHFNASFVTVEDNGQGMAIFTEGNHEYENLEDGNLAFTAVRSTGAINRDANFKLVGGKYWEVEDNQCLRTINFRMAVTPYAGLQDRKELFVKAKRFRTPLLCTAASCNPKKFSGGRTAVQDTRLIELFYKSDLYANLCLKDSQPILEIKGKNIVVSALKKTEDKKDVLIRLLNLSEKTEELTVTSNTLITESNMEEEYEGRSSQNTYTNPLQPKKISTLKLKTN